MASNQFDAETPQLRLSDVNAHEKATSSTSAKYRLCSVRFFVCAARTVSQSEAADLIERFNRRELLPPFHPRLIFGT